MEIYGRYLVAVAVVVILTRWLTRKADPLFGWPLLLPALVARIIFGTIYGYFFLQQYGGDDTWMINTDSLVELQKLTSRPGQFFEDIDIFRLVSENGWSDGLRIFREKLEWALLIKPLAIANLWSQGNYYINVVFFSGISFWGAFWLYRLVKSIRPDFSKWTYLVLFLYPPTLFWLSGIRGDALLFFFFSLTLWQFYQWLGTRRVKNAAGWLIGLAGMLVIRTVFGIMLLPALIGWWLVVGWKWPAKKAFSRVYAVAILLFFCSGLLPGPLNGPAQVVERQEQFFSLKGNTRVNIGRLKADPVSFLQILPQAIDNVFWRPYPWEARGMVQYAVVIQNIFLICLLMLFIVRRYPGRAILSGAPLFLVLFCFSLSAYLSIGYTIPFPGALVRYRAIPETCLLLIVGIAAFGGRLSNYNFFNVYKKKVN